MAPIVVVRPVKAFPVGSRWGWALALPVAAGLAAALALAVGTGRGSPPDSQSIPPSISPVTTVVGAGGLVPDKSIAHSERGAFVFVVDPELHLLVATPVMIEDRIGTANRQVKGVSSGQTILVDPTPVEQRLALY